jgi:hypothetical protein
VHTSCNSLHPYGKHHNDHNTLSNLTHSLLLPSTHFTINLFLCPLCVAGKRRRSKRLSMGLKAAESAMPNIVRMHLLRIRDIDDCIERTAPEQRPQDQHLLHPLHPSWLNRHRRSLLSLRLSLQQRHDLQHPPLLQILLLLLLLPLQCDLLLHRRCILLVL